MSRKISDWSNFAFNQVPDSDNRIHSDEMAEAYGFTGALVPGVTVSAYLIHPAVEAWGLEWLKRGYALVKILAPLYDHALFQVEVKDGDDHKYSAQLKSEERLCAVAEVELPGLPPLGSEYQGHPLMSGSYEPLEATRRNMEALRKSGCPAKKFLWSADREMATYLRDQSCMPALLRTDNAPESQGYANPAFLLGCANRHLAAVATMSPWIHMETQSWNYQAVQLGTELISEMTITDLFNKKGHEFCDCVFNLFKNDTKECVCAIEQRAIYRMRST